MNETILRCQGPMTTLDLSAIGDSHERLFATVALKKGLEVRYQPIIKGSRPDFHVVNLRNPVSVRNRGRYVEITASSYQRYSAEHTSTRRSIGGLRPGSRKYRQLQRMRQHPGGGVILFAENLEAMRRARVI